MREYCSEQQKDLQPAVLKKRGQPLPDKRWLSPLL